MGKFEKEAGKLQIGIICGNTLGSDYIIMDKMDKQWGLSIKGYANDQVEGIRSLEKLEVLIDNKEEEWISLKEKWKEK